LCEVALVAARRQHLYLPWHAVQKGVLPMPNAAFKKQKQKKLFLLWWDLWLPTLP
jgi:hypothetical protein